MAKRTPGQVYADLIAAGFDAAQASVMTAIAGAESAFNDTAVGDVGLETTTWGPSYGLFQIRTLKGATGSGSDRDIAALTGDDLAQAHAAYRISQGGTDFTPWSTYTNGAYQKFLDKPTAAAAAGDGGKPFPTLGPAWLPWNLPSDAGNAIAGQLGGARTIVVEAVFVLLGLGLLAAGAVAITRPDRALARTAGVAAKVGKVVAL